MQARSIATDRAEKRRRETDRIPLLDDEKRSLGDMDPKLRHPDHGALFGRYADKIREPATLLRFWSVYL